MAEIIAQFLELIESIKFWKKKKARRKFERDHGLPKKIMISPLSALLLLVFLVILVISALAKFL